jgi:hypothetical protein
MRKRVDVQAEEAARESGGVDAPPAQEAPRVGASPKLPMEDQFSEMCIELQKRGYGLVRLMNVTEWLPQVRHIVAMWLAGQISEDQVPEAIKAFKGEKKDEHPHAAPPPADAKPRELREKKLDDYAAEINRQRKRVAVGQDAHPTEPARTPGLVRTPEGVKTRLQDEADRDQAAHYAREAKQDSSGPVFRIEHVDVAWGEEKYTPVPYQTFSVGPFSARIALGPGESPEAAIGRGYAVLDAFAKRVREKKLDDYVAEINRQRKKIGAEGR